MGRGARLRPRMGVTGAAVASASVDAGTSVRGEEEEGGSCVEEDEREEDEGRSLERPPVVTDPPPPPRTKSNTGGRTIGEIARCS